MIPNQAPSVATKKFRSVFNAYNPSISEHNIILNSCVFTCYPLQIRYKTRDQTIKRLPGSSSRFKCRRTGLVRQRLPTRADDPTFIEEESGIYNHLELPLTRQRYIIYMDHGQWSVENT